MSDVERLVLETLRRHETEVPLSDPSEARPVARRTRRRQVLNALGAGLVAVVIAVGATAGIGALLRASEQRPAATLEPPTGAPVVVGSGTSDGWDWLLSASADGACVALTDAQGSDVSCEGGASDPTCRVVVGADCPPTDIIDVGVRSPRPPAPPLMLMFGRVPSQTADVKVRIATGEETRGEVFSAPEGVDLDVRFYVEWLAGYAYPFVPNATLVARHANGTIVGVERNGRIVGLEPLTLERPSWAEAPTFTVLETIASGTLDEGLVGAMPWEISIFRNEATGQLCVGEPGRAANVCGPEDDPVPAWVSALSRLEEVGGWDAVDQSLVWGVMRDPIESVKVVRWVGTGLNVERGGSDDALLYDLPSEYERPFTIFVYRCNGPCAYANVLGLDADGNVIERA